jgi:hypothetical protein
MDRLPINGCNDIENVDWIVTAKVEGEYRRFKVSALSEQAACIDVEDRYGVEAISARLANAINLNAGRCPICAGRRCNSSHD